MALVHPLAEVEAEVAMAVGALLLLGFLPLEPPRTGSARVPRMKMMRRTKTSRSRRRRSTEVQLRRARSSRLSRKKVGSPALLPKTNVRILTSVFPLPGDEWEEQIVN